MLQKGKVYLLVSAFYFFCIALMGFYCFKRPLYNWDMLPYENLILKLDGFNAKEAHSQTYQLTRENIPEEYFRQLTDTNHAYRSRMMKDAAAFEDELPFYIVKPLYIGFSYLFYKAGTPLPQATKVPAIISYLLIGLLLFYWLRRYVPLPITFLVALLLMWSPPFTYVAKISSPDCLSNLFVTGVFFFIIEKPSLKNATILMGLSVFTRLDNIMTCIFILSLIYFGKKWHRQISIRLFLPLIALLGFCYLLVGLTANHYGWSVLFYNDFADRLHPLYGSTEHFSIKDYFRLMYEHALSGLRNSFLPIFMALLVLRFSKAYSLKKLGFEEQCLLLIPLIMAIRFIFYPDISDRFYIAFYIVIIISLAKQLSGGEITSIKSSQIK